MAHGDLAGEAGRERAPGDLAELEAAERAGVVQVDVEADAMALGDREDRVEMTVEVIVDAGGIEAADEIGAGPIAWSRRSVMPGVG